MAARRERLPEGDRRERMARVAESRNQKPSPFPRPATCDLRPQSSSATARIISLRPSAVHAIGVIISVPTPASR